MKRIQQALLAVFILLAIIVFSPVSFADQVAEGFEIHFLDVGQADSAIIICDGEVLMIDGGNSADSSLVFSYLKNTLNVSHIDFMVNTHPHEDHVGGLSGALNACSVGKVFSPVLEYDSEAFHDFLRYVSKQGKSLQVPKAGDSYPLGSATLQFLTPLRTNYLKENDWSLVIRVSYGATSFLFMGDAELSVEADMIMASHDKLYKLKSDLIKAGHHGGETSTSFTLLQAVKPKYVVISVGEDNSYGHPSPYTLDRLKTAKVSIYRTDRDGHIICFSDGETITFKTEKNDSGIR